jgi:hypothetical protein
MAISMTEISNNRQPKNNNKNQTLIAAAVFQILFSTVIYFIGANELLPSMFDTRGIGEFASDGVQHLREITSLVESIRNHEVREYVVSTSSFHLKLYAFSFLLLEPLFGFTTLSAEIINLICYISILWLVNDIGKQLFNPEVGLYSMWGIALWPSFVLYTTQLYKTPLFILMLLILIFVFARLLLGYQHRILLIPYFVIALIALTILWLIRYEWWLMFIGIVSIGVICLVVNMVKFRHQLFGNSIILVLFLFAVFGFQFYASDVIAYIRQSLTAPLAVDAKVELPTVERSSDSGNSLETSSSSQSDAETPTPAPSPAANYSKENIPTAEESPTTLRNMIKLWESAISGVESIASRIGGQRYGFSEISTSGSKIDHDVNIKTSDDLIRYLPRALAIGLFAPFPDMWFADGAKLGLSARLLSGVETLIMYVIYGFAALGVWHSRRQVSAWYLVSVILVGVIALGTVVVNIGALYRFRYAFWMIVIVFGAGGYKQVALPYLRTIFDKRR